MIRRWLLPLSLLGSFALTVGVAWVLYATAAPRYLPSGGSVWILRGAPGVVPPSGSATLLGDAGTPLPATLLLATFNSSFLVVLAVGIALVLGVPLGFYLALHAPRRLETALRALTNIGVGVPAFFLAFLLQVLAVEAAGRLGHSIVPVFGFGIDGHLVIPVIALTAGPLAYVTRVVAVHALDLGARDFVRTARAKGLREAQVIYRHIVPNMVGVLGEGSLGATRMVLGSLVIVEYLLGWPGLGLLLLRAVKLQESAALLLGVLLLGMLFVAVDLALDAITQRTGAVSG